MFFLFLPNAYGSTISVDTGDPSNQKTTFAMFAPGVVSALIFKDVPTSAKLIVDGTGPNDVLGGLMRVNPVSTWACDTIS